MTAGGDDFDLLFDGFQVGGVGLDTDYFGGDDLFGFFP
jgi:hypothetical protein